MPRISARLTGWALEVLELGFARISAGDHTPAIFVIDQTGEHHTVVVRGAKMITDPLLVETAKEIVGQTFSGAKYYAVVSVADLTIDEGTFDVIAADVGACDLRQAFTLAQRYRQKSRSKKLEKIGKPIMLGPTEHLLTPGKRPTRGPRGKQKKRRPTARSKRTRTRS